MSLDLRPFVERQRIHHRVGALLLASIEAVYTAVVARNVHVIGRQRRQA